MSLERFVVDVIEGRRKAPLTRLAFRLFGCIYRALITGRNFLYDRGFFKIHRANAYVVSIGNIVCGGTGKTPFLCMLADLIKEHVPIAILTRGYRSAIEQGKTSIQISQDEKITYPVEQCGDEPYLIATHTGCSVFVGKDRVQSAKMASENGYKILLLDDGMQHRRLYRNEEIVLLDAKDLWGQGSFIPGGLLRDEPKRLKTADLIVVGSTLDVSHRKKIEKEITYYTKAPIVFVARDYHIDLISGAHIGVFCGIAKPSQFEEALKQLGFHVVDRFYTADHILPSYDELASFAERCRQSGAIALVCTEKDFVKLKKDHVFSLPVICLHMQMNIVEGGDIWKRFINKILTEGKAFPKSRG